MVMAWPINPPVDDSPVANRQSRWRMTSPRLRANRSSSASSGGRTIISASSVIGELQRHRVVQSAQVRDDCLELVLALGAHAHRVALDDRLHLGESVPNTLRQLLGLLGCEAALQRDLLADGATRRGLQLPPLEDLEGEAAPNRLGLDEVTDRLGAELVVRGERDLALSELQAGATALEVVPRRDLAADLVERVHQLLLVEVAHHVEARFCRHLSSGPRSPILPARALCNAASATRTATGRSVSARSPPRPRPPWRPPRSR